MRAATPTKAAILFSIERAEFGQLREQGDAAYLSDSGRGCPATPPFAGTPTCCE